MRNIITLFALLVLVASCKEDLVQKPKKLIDKEIMVNIMYDLSVLEAIKYQNPTSLDTFKIDAKDFIYKKYKVDSLQFVKSNIYYAADYESYKSMFDKVSKRLEASIKSTNALVKREKKKNKTVPAKTLKSATPTTLKVK